MEVLIAVVILSIVSIAAEGLFFAFTKHFEQSTDLTTARQRGEMTLARLETAVLQAGLSMPNRTADFEGVFVVGTSPQINLLTPLRNVISGGTSPCICARLPAPSGDYLPHKPARLRLGSGIGVLEGHEVADNTPLCLNYRRLAPITRKGGNGSVDNRRLGYLSGCQAPFVAEIS